ncbi:MAG: valine--tRNA ligase [Chloroflexi bacterium]|uniref:Valine--tRNA ligase n=1 Tax=Candidatus Chlorohelix allophototropha TaxID=3003348 RepID=A0A8T7M268_9CHLR|nr:valine--tRNA ligase [Chloroflexota bacterium]WJW65681.1 valine--tRNA ligase [Chloroflexota bacterium L227-S17]
MTDTNRKEMPKAYDPKTTEERLYKFWEENGWFTPKIDSKRKPYVIIMPPPNVTGALHQGHAMFVGVEDALVRWRRMNGDSVLWLPGSDHAGISAETVLEKQVRKEFKKSKNEIGRDAFLKRMWQWMDEYRDVIVNQLRVLGASCDWTRKCFTMDEGPQRAVRTIFKKMYDEGLIYQAERIVNWCPGSQTVVSDLEVNMVEEEGFLWHIRYPVKGEPERYVIVATTRPETMLGDTSVAVHPEDERYKDLHGKMLILPLMNRKIPIVADAGVDKEFGTGAVKVTPGHDPLDFEIGQRHNLPVITILNLDATINENGGQYQGLERFAARKQVVKDLEEQGYLVKTEPYRHSVPYSEKAGVPIEPLVRMQWWLKIQPLSEPALQAALDGRVKFVPERFTKVYTQWLENIHDWNISRQLFWGHRIPVWYCGNCGKQTCTADDSLKACEHCGSDKVTQDADVLDTWFSSGLWTFSTLGWPDQTEDLAYFYPGAVMETGYDIIFFWVARMIMLGIYAMGEPPFHTVYLHGLVRDEKGEKMSKSKGNTIDPLETIDKYGSDALRFTLLTSSTPGVDTKLSFSRIVDSRNFANKIWNATRFITMNLEAEMPPVKDEDLQFTPGMPLADRWVISRYSLLAQDVSRLMETYQLGEAGRLIYDFLWSEFCDWYIESCKIRLSSGNPEEKLAVQKVLVGVLERSLRLLHPFMPFVTEELWQNLPHSGEALIIADWPAPLGEDPDAVRSFEELQEVIRAVRNAKVEAKVESKRVPAIVLTKPEELALFESEKDTLIRLAGIEATGLQIVDQLAEAPAQAMALVTTAATVYLPLSGLLDLEQERARLSKEIEDAQREAEKSIAMLSNSNFVDRAPAPVVEKEREKLAAAQERAVKLQERLNSLL